MMYGVGSRLASCSVVPSPHQVRGLLNFGCALASPAPIEGGRRFRRVSEACLGGVFADG